MDQAKMAVPGPAIGPAGVFGGIAREKYWHEKSAEEKCIKLGEAVEYMAREIRELRQQSDRMRVHVHADEKVMVPLDRNEPDHVSYVLRNPLGKWESY